MAKVLYGIIGAELRGKLGGAVFSRNRYGAYVRNKTSPVQPRSPAQMLIRAAFTQISQAWRDILIPAERAAWDDYAKQTQKSDVFGNKGNLTGAVMFVRYNTGLVGILAAILKVAPVLPGEAQMAKVTLTATAAVGVSIATLLPALTAGDYAIAYSNKAPIPQSREFFNGPWTLRKSMDSTQTFPAVIIDPAECAIGQRWWVSTRLYAKDGKVGPRGMTRVDIVA